MTRSCTENLCDTLYLRVSVVQKNTHMNFDTIYQYNFPTTIRFGAGACNEFGDYLKENTGSQGHGVTRRTFATLCASVTPWFKKTHT